jgi:ATP-dependent Clp protease, protease subunit
MPRINKESIDRFYDYDIHIETRTIYIGSVEADIEKGESGVDSRMSERAIKALHLLDQKNEPITIIMSNPGGDWYYGMAIYDAIKACESHVTIKVMGLAMSMGAVILQAADERLMAPNAKFMLHYGYMGMTENHSKIFKRWADESEKINENMELIFLENIKEKHPNFTLQQVKELLNFDTIYNAQETVDIGLADGIIK